MNPEDRPDAARIGLLRAHLARLGVPPQVANQVILEGRTNRENAISVISYCKTLPKKA